MPAPPASSPLKPTKKVASGGVAASLTIIVVYVAGLLGLDVPAEVASAFTTLVGFGVAWKTGE